MYPELAKVGDDLREIQANLTFSLLELERPPVVPRVLSDGRMNLGISSVFCSSQCCGI